MKRIVRYLLLILVLVVVVRLALEHGDHLNRDQWLSDIIRALP